MNEKTNENENETKNTWKRAMMKKTILILISALFSFSLFSLRECGGDVSVYGPYYLSEDLYFS